MAAKHVAAELLHLHKQDSVLRKKLTKPASGSKTLSMLVGGGSASNQVASVAGTSVLNSVASPLALPKQQLQLEDGPLGPLTLALTPARPRKSE